MKLYRNSYCVYEDGRVYSLKTNRFLTHSRINNGYYIVSIKDKSEFVHRLIAKLFVDNPKGAPDVNHKDGNKANNAASNLEWCTKSENMIHAVNNGLYKGRRKKTSVFYKGSHLGIFDSVIETEKATGVARHLIRKSVRMNYSHNGYSFQFP